MHFSLEYLITKFKNVLPVHILYKTQQLKLIHFWISGQFGEKSEITEFMAYNKPVVLLHFQDSFVSVLKNHFPILFNVSLSCRGQNVSLISCSEMHIPK